MAGWIKAAGAFKGLPREVRDNIVAIGPAFVPDWPFLRLTNVVPVVSARDLQFVGTDADLCCLSASDRRPSDMCTTDNW